MCECNACCEYDCVVFCTLILVVLFFSITEGNEFFNGVQFSQVLKLDDAAEWWMWK